jgi:prepilin-type N-terminal cleavage/methylation domain-containing protein
MMKNRLSGFTLIETIITIVLLSMSMMMIGQYAVLATSISTKLINLISADQAVNLLSQDLNTDILTTSSAAVNGNSVTLTTSGTSNIQYVLTSGELVRNLLSKSDGSTLSSSNILKANTINFNLITNLLTITVVCNNETNTFILYCG